MHRSGEKFESAGENDMLIENIPLSVAKLYESLLSELRPTWNVNITTIDYNLCKLGFVDEPPCSFSLDISDKQIEELYEEIIDMEVDVYLYENLLYANPINMTMEEKEKYKEIKKCERKYEKYKPLEAICNY